MGCGPGARARTTVPRSSSRWPQQVGHSCDLRCFFWLENVIRDHPIGICENIQEAFGTAYELVRRNADVIVPLYDPANFDRFPDGGYDEQGSDIEHRCT